MFIALALVCVCVFSTLLIFPWRWWCPPRYIEKIQNDYSLRLVIKTAKTTGVKAIIIDGEGVLGSEVTFWPFPEETDVAHYPIEIKSRMAYQLHVKVLLGFPLSNFYHAVSVMLPLGKFTCFVPAQQSDSSLSFATS